MKKVLSVLILLSLSCHSEKYKLGYILHGGDYKLWEVRKNQYWYFDKRENQTVYCKNGTDIKLKECEESDVLKYEDWEIFNEDSIRVGFSNFKVTIFKEDSIKIGETILVAVPKDKLHLSEAEKEKAGIPLRYIK